MTLLALLISLAIGHFIDSINELRKLEWFPKFVNWARSRMGEGQVWNGPLGVFVVIAPLVLAVGWVQQLLDQLLSNHLL